MTECDSLNIHGIGKIQSFGYLVSLDKKSNNISHVSRNICDLSFSKIKDPLKLIGMDIYSCFSSNVSGTIAYMIREYSNKSYNSRRYGSPIDSYIIHNGESYVFIIDESAFEYVFEILLDTPPKQDILSMYTEVMETIMVSSNHRDLFEETCGFVSENLGYERAMVYRFLEDMSGEVLHEWINPSVKDSLEPYIGMRFPESDIPLPARMMYTLKPIRFIHDTHSTPVTIVGHKPLNLSRCITRSSHDVHISYMKNMGVRSSMSLGIIVDEDLWGILSFHSYNKPIKPHIPMIRLVESISTPFSTILVSVTRAINLSRDKHLVSVMDKIFIYKDMKSFFSENYQDLLTITGTECVAIYEGESSIEYRGDASISSFTEDVSQLEGERLRDGYFVGTIENPLRGVMYFFHGDNRVIFYRKTSDLEITWGGDPSHVKVRRPDGVPGPRGSFERFIRKKESFLEPWTSIDEGIMSYLSSRLMVFIKTKKKMEMLSTRVINNRDIVCNSVKPDRVDSFLITHMSHELVTPLSGISNAMRIVLEDKMISREEIDITMENGLDCVDRMNKTIREVLSIPGFETIGDEGYIHRDNEIISIKSMIDSMVSKHSPEMDISGIELSLENSVETDNSILGSHASIITRSISSVMDNSIRFTKKGGSIKLSVHRYSTNRESILSWKESTSDLHHRSITNVDSDLELPETSAWYMFSVRDSGCGVHEDMITGVMNIIDNTSDSSENTINNSHQGVSMGLYKVMMDILKINGTVAIASSLGVGTSISLTIPLSEDTCNVRKAIDSIPTDVKDGVFFIVDDSKINRKMTSRLLKMACKKSLGFEPRVQEFSDGRLCMDEVMKMQRVGDKPLCIIMDYHMPVMSGKEATEKIRKLENDKGLQKIPIVGYTADVTERTREDLISSGMNRVIPKPVTIDVLKEMCMKMIF